MFANQEIQEILSAINNMQESRTGGWINNNELKNKLNIGVRLLVSLIDKGLIEAGGMYSRLTGQARDLLVIK
jgi:hypothetical protein